MTEREGLSRQQKAEGLLEELIPPAQCSVIWPLFESAREKGIEFAVGGGIAFSLYTGHYRNTKDVDLFLLPFQSGPFLDLMNRHGFAEYTEAPYDRVWSYRGRKKGYILDVLWGRLNERKPLQEEWVRGGWVLNWRGMPFRLLAVEEVIRSKLHIIYRDRCDWPDLLGLLYTHGQDIDWKQLLDRLEESAPVLGGVLVLYRWICPGASAQLPEWVWPALGLTPGKEEEQPVLDMERAALLRCDDIFRNLEGREDG